MGHPIWAFLKRTFLPFEDHTHPLHYDHAAEEARKQEEVDAFDRLLRDEDLEIDDLLAPRQKFIGPRLYPPKFLPCRICGSQVQIPEKYRQSKSAVCSDCSALGYWK